MNKFYVITNSTKDVGLVTTKIIQEYLHKHEKECLVQDRVAHSGNKKYRYTDVDKIPADTECVLVLGGDGTLLQATRDMMERDIPLIGINLGTLGYLAEINTENIVSALDTLMADEYTLTRRMMLEGKAYNKEKMILRDTALNDIVIGREGRPRIIDFNIYVDGEFLSSYSADGIIVSTPTGSTGYSLSAGGPIISPEASLLLLTPIAPHTLNTRSIVLPDSAVITIEVGKQRLHSEEKIVATFDGDTYVALKRGDIVTISKATKAARLVKINNISFLEMLRKKMNDQ